MDEINIAFKLHEHINFYWHFYVPSAIALLGWNPGDDREVMEIGEIIEVQNMCIALPSVPKKITNTNNRWEPAEYPKELNQIKTVFEWEERPEQFAYFLNRKH